MAKMIPTIMKTCLLGDWVIVTRFTHKNGYAIAHTKYPIDPILLEQITYDVLLKEAKDCEKGYSFEITQKETGEVFKVTVERKKKVD